MAVNKADVTEIRVPGTKFDIQLKSIYTIEPKWDMRGSPKSYKRAGFTKVPDFRVTTTVSPKWDDDRKLWDFALDKNSPAFRGMDEDESRRLLQKLTAVIINPLMEIKPEGFLDVRPRKEKEVLEEGYVGPENHNIVLGLDRSFDTSKVEDLFNLYTAIYIKDLCPKEMEDDPQYREADFCVLNSKQTISNKEEKAYIRDKAVSKLINTWDTDKKFALKLLKYCEISVAEESNEQTVASYFRRWLDDRDDRGGYNAKYFLESYSNFSTEEGELELQVWMMLDKMKKNGEIKKRGGEFFRGSDNIGSNLKVYAKEVVKDEEMTMEILGAKI